MAFLLKLALGMDKLSTKFAQLACWMVLLSAVFSAGNAFVRYGANWSSNALLEIQWYLFAWTVMAGAPYVLKVNEHVRVDLIYSKLHARQRVWMDLFGITVFLLPVMGLMAYLSWPYFYQTFASQEMSQNAGGLIRWPVTLALPVGFGLVFVQGLAELVKRAAFLLNSHDLNTDYEAPLQ